MDIPATDLAAAVTAHDKLLKALIGLLAVKDRHLLDDLRAIFAMVDDAHPGATPAEARTWAQVRRDLDIIGEMVAGDDEEPPADRPAH
ncbi:hypothetical protein [Phenylobacterium sp.]|uniref:hypothetical protein n=1 Tax=Phenylobacterium sp. TaxID=1871053 RepID=UPI0025FC8B6A|nr:hypothetical protein [Phenylobacterium sp.]